MIAAALAEIDTRGLEGFNIRNLAKRLGVYPTAVYWYVPTRNQILSEVVAVVFHEIPPPRAGCDWRTCLRDLFGGFRTSFRQHPNVAPLVGAHLIGNLSIPLDFVERVLVALSEAGLKGQGLAAGYNAIIAALVGFVVQEFSPLPSEGTEAWQSAVKQRLLSAEPARHPVLTANLPVLANKAFILRWQSGNDAPLDRSFEAFTEAVIAGIENMRGRRKA